MGDEGISERQGRIWFWGILAVAALLRILAFNSFSAHHPDELIQYLEQAHRIVFGYGVVPWEFRDRRRASRSIRMRSSRRCRCSSTR